MTTQTPQSSFLSGAEALDRGQDGLALWSQLESELRRRLDLGHFRDRFPTDRELMDIYGVSRHTARHAVNRLGADGIVRRSRGVGTLVDHQRVEQSLGSLYSLFQVVEEAGVEQRSRVLLLERTTDPVASAQLGLESGSELVVLARVRFADDEPLAIDRVWLPAEIGESLLDLDFSTTSLYDELERTVGRRPSAGWERIRAIVPEPEERALLGIDSSEAVLCIHRLGVCHDRPVEWRTTLIRGDRFGFIARWSLGQRTDLRPELTGESGDVSADPPA
ncbi:MAG: GntR family transcriptional regulator [Ilumatobacteraceae bacterium]|jgi:GntR family transcriptional regulator